MKVAESECRRKFQRVGERREIEGEKNEERGQKQNQDDSIVKGVAMEGHGRTKRRDGRKRKTPRKIVDGNVASETGDDSQRGHEKWVGSDGGRDASKVRE
jgi:hypothetical protein